VTDLPQHFELFVWEAQLLSREVAVVIVGGYVYWFATIVPYLVAELLTGL
jgi:hypothetical protein